MIIKHSQIRGVIKFVGVVIFSISLYKKVKQIFIYGGMAVPELPYATEDEEEPIEEAKQVDYNSPMATYNATRYN